MPTSSLPLEERLKHAFTQADGVALNGSSDKLSQSRREALAHVERLGFPGARSEAYKYTKIRKRLEAHDFAVALSSEGHGVTASDVDAAAIADFGGARIVLVNGRFVPELSSLGEQPSGVLVMNLEDAIRDHADLVETHLGRYAAPDREVFNALSSAFIKDGFFVYVPEGSEIEAPIHIVHLAKSDEPVLSLARGLVVAEAGAKASVVEQHSSLSSAPSFSVPLTEFFVGAKAHVTHYRIQDEGEGHDQVSNLGAYQEGESHFGTLTFTFSGGTIRNNVSILPDAEECKSEMYGLFLNEGAMHVDTHTFMDHAKPNCLSDEFYKGILEGKSRGVFNGKILVRQDAQQTNAYQTNQCVVLSDDARMYSKPELEIYADDVQCSHGATTGELDHEALFYLRSRGIPERRAKAMLLLAFARDILDKVELKPVAEYVDEVLHERYG
jgi:Fe-S cluster assembly protein SufD